MSDLEDADCKHSREEGYEEWFCCSICYGVYSKSGVRDLQVAIAAERARSKHYRDALKWLNLKGGLGLDVHRRIDAALDEKPPPRDMNWHLEPDEVDP